MKWEWYRHKNIEKFGTINSEIENEIKNLEKNEGPLMRRLEYMYQWYDYDNDIEKVRNRMFNQELQRASIWDVGEILNEITERELAENEYYDGIKYISQDFWASKDVKSKDVRWTDKLADD